MSLIVTTFSLLCLSSCGSKSSGNYRNGSHADGTFIKDSSNTESDNKVIEPTSCSDYTDNYSVPYKYCDSGSDIFSIQEALNREGYPVDIDGYYGPATRNAVKRFQLDNGLSATGQVGSSTWTQLIGSSSGLPATSSPVSSFTQYSQRAYVTNTTCKVEQEFYNEYNQPSRYIIRITTYYSDGKQVSSVQSSSSGCP